MVKIKMLYCDSNETVCEAFEMYCSLAYRNLALDTSFENKDVFDKLSLSRYDIVFYDIGMDEDLRYYPLARKIKNDYNTTLIAMSNHLPHHNLPEFFDDKISSFDVCQDTDIFHMLLKMHGIKLRKK